MRKASLCLLGGVLLAFAAVTTYAAQDQGNGKKPPKQTHDNGVDDDDQVPPGQAKRPTGERNTDAVKVSVRPNGILIAELDESFEDALVVTREADGTVRYTCIHGLPAAEHHVLTPQTPVSSAPVLEEK
jgi:hypothetical protein